MGLGVFSGTVMPVQMHAQGVTSGGITGTVKAANGGVVPGARIIAIHIPTGTRFGANAKANGTFTINNVRVGGPYTIKATAVGFGESSLSGQFVKLGQNLKISMALSEKAVATDEITVMAQKGVFGASRNGAQTNISKEQLNNFPTISRSFQDFAKFTPQVVSTGSGVSVAGRNNRYNNIQIDGSNYTDLFGLGSAGTPGGQANTNPVSLDAIDEFQVLVAPYDVRQGRFTGGGVNAITRSGTNKFEGSAYWFTRSQAMISDLSITRKNIVNNNLLDPGTKDTTITTTFNNFNELQTGVRLGGPIIQDKLFFFANAEFTSRVQPVDNISLTQNSRATQIDSIAQLVSSHLTSTYGYNPGQLRGFEITRPSTKVFARLDWNIDDNNRLTFRNNYVSAYDDNYSTTVTSTRFSDRNYRFNNSQNSTVLELNSSLGDDMHNELILGYTRIRDFREVTGKPFSAVTINDPSMGSGNEIVFGSEQFSNFNKLDQDVIEITNNFTLSLDENHTLTIGTQNEIFSFRNLFIRDAYGTYRFNSLANFLSGNAASVSMSFARPGFPNDWAAEFGAMQLGAYIQDDIKVSDNFKVNAGLRVDVPVFPDAPSYNYKAENGFVNTADVSFAANGNGSIKYANDSTRTLGWKTSEMPKSTLLFSPRLGFNWDVNGDQSFQVRGGAGIFTGRVPFVWISNHYGNTGVEIARLTLNTAGADTVKFNPDIANSLSENLKDTTKVASTTELNLTGNDFKMPQTFRMNLGFDYKLPEDIILTVDGLYSKNLNEIAYTDLNLGERRDTTQFGSTLPGNRGVFGIYNGRNTNARFLDGRKNFTNVILLNNTDMGYSYNVSVQLQKSWKSGLDLMAAYTHSASYDINSGLSSQAVSQWRFNYIQDNPNTPTLSRSYFDIPHRMIASAAYRIELAPEVALKASLFYEGRSGQPFSYVYDGDLNADGQTGNDLIYIPKDRNDIALISGSARANDATYDALDRYITNDDALNAARGTIIERNAAREPWNNRIDLRIAADIRNPFADGHNLEVSLDIINLGSNAYRFVPNQSDALLRFEGLARAGNTFGSNGAELPVGTPMFSYRDKENPYQYSDLLSRMQMQLGIRYSF
jgi:outer membrane receptor protein involved in Fe transport